MKENYVDIALLGFIGFSLAAYVAACFYPGITPEIREGIKEVMQWFGLALGIGGAAAMAKKNN